MAESTGGEGGAAGAAVEVEPETTHAWRRPTGRFSTNSTTAADDGVFVFTVEPGVDHTRIAEMLVRLAPPPGWLLDKAVELRFTVQPASSGAG